MVPVFFPFTYLSDSDAMGLAACFNRIAVWLPSSTRLPQSMQLLADQGKISLRYPFGEDNALLEESLKQLEGWADLHGPRHLRQQAEQFATKRGNRESSVYDILHELKPYQGGQGPDKHTNEPSEDPLIETFGSAGSNWIQRSRLFLQIAQVFDQRCEALRNDLDAVDALEQHFQAALHATSDEMDTGKVSASGAYDHIERDYMPAERIRAWASFLAAPLVSSFKPNCRMLVTTSQTVESIMVNAVPGMAPGLDLAHISSGDSADEAHLMWRNDLEQWLMSWKKESDHPQTVPVPKTPDKVHNQPSVSLTVYRANLSPHDWLIQAVGNGETIQDCFNGLKADSTTLLACVKNEQNSTTN